MGRYDNKVKQIENDSMAIKPMCTCGLTCKTYCNFTCKGTSTKSISPPKAVK